MSHEPRDDSHDACRAALAEKSKEFDGLKAMLNDALRRNEEYVSEWQGRLAEKEKEAQGLREEVKRLNRRPATALVGDNTLVIKASDFEATVSRAESAERENQALREERVLVEFARNLRLNDGP